MHFHRLMPAYQFTAMKGTAHDEEGNLSRNRADRARPYSQAIVAGGFVRGLLISIAAVAVLPSA
jgi:hypothetical protein